MSSSVVVTFFATFDDLKGPTVVYSAPSGAFEEGSEGRRIWELYSDLLMSGNPQLDGRAVQVRAGEDGVLCVPVVLRDDEKYRRNALLFSLGIIAPGLEGLRSCRGMLERMSRALRAMELESSLLSRGQDLASIVPAALRSLRRTARLATGLEEEEEEFEDLESEALTLRDDPNVFTLERPMSWTKVDAPAVPQVKQWEVPVLLARPRALLDLSTPSKLSRILKRDKPPAGDDAWDLAIQQVIPHVNGIRNVRQVARASRVDLEIVAKCLRVLRHYRCLALVDAFQYSNVYRVAARVGDLATNEGALENCVDFVLKPDIVQVDVDAALREAATDHSPFSSSGDLEKRRRSDDDKGARRHRPSTERAAIRILRLYCDFKDGRSMKDVLLAANYESPLLVDALDHRAFAAFGVVHGILERVHRYPVARLTPAAAADKLHARRASSSPGGARPRDRRRPRATRGRRGLAPSGAAAAAGYSSLEEEYEVDIIDDEPEEEDGSPHLLRPTLGRGDDDRPPLDPYPEPVDLAAKILFLMDGSHCMDEICTDLEMPPSKVQAIVRNAGYLILNIFR
ncbi:hypothetical protein CTAYLR_006291 [Chrysophaeum taylorii]|uniref:Nitrogen permease regulator 2 n=1 Tax=Chrysophaeum taylorii TaxID=2483200 RepID=A0AAD7ULH8_9STRA|nr:hypothetical protein CTAYLR_006291 [Chrysophaeum taylorii]